MLATQRQRFILDRITSDGAVVISRLSDQLDVSRETIRRDINALAARNRLQKTHGGAVTLGPVEPDEAERRSSNAAGKRAIGRAAAARVPDGASVILDSGTTTRSVAEALRERRRLAVFTNDLLIAQILGRRNDNKLVLLGGELQPHEDATLGWDTIETLSRYHADFAFVGAGGITKEGDLTDFTREASELRGRMLRSAREACVVADHTKFNRVTPVLVAHFGRDHLLVTDRQPDQALRGRLKRKGVQLLIAGP